MSSHGVPRSAKKRNEEQRQDDRAKIEKYQALENQLRALIKAKQYDSETYHLTSQLLRKNPEYYTVWNVRRRCLTSGPLSRPLVGSSLSKQFQSSSASANPTPSSAVSSYSSLSETRPAQDSQKAGMNGSTHEDDASKSAETSMDAIHNELGFTVPLLIEFPKCYWIWNYRLWVLAQAETLLEVSTARRTWQEELGLVGKMLSKDRRNFHAWTYRRLVVAELESSSLGAGSLVEPEFDYTTEMIKVDLSNFSAWHNRAKLIPKLLKERNATDQERRALLEDELTNIRNALNVGPEDQSLWYYHQYLVANVCDSQDELAIVPSLSQEERVSYVVREIEEVEDLLEDYADIKWIYEGLIEYSLAVSRIGGRVTEQKGQGQALLWLRKLRDLDPQRIGRWNDLEHELASTG